MLVLSQLLSTFFFLCTHIYYLKIKKFKLHEAAIYILLTSNIVSVLGMCVYNIYLGADVRGISTGDKFSQKAVQLGAFDVSITCGEKKIMKIHKTHDKKPEEM